LRKNPKTVNLALKVTRKTLVVYHIPDSTQSFLRPLCHIDLAPIQMMVEAIQQPAVLWVILGGAVLTALFEVYKTSPDALWGDILGDESQE